MGAAAETMDALNKPERLANTIALTAITRDARRLSQRTPCIDLEWRSQVNVDLS